MAQTGQVSHVATTEFRVPGNVPRGSRGVHLFAQVVVNANRMIAMQQSVGGMRSYKAGAPGNQDLLTLRQLASAFPLLF